MPSYSNLAGRLWVTNRIDLQFQGITGVRRALHCDQVDSLAFGVIQLDRLLLPAMIVLMVVRLRRRLLRPRPGAGLPADGLRVFVAADDFVVLVFFLAMGSSIGVRNAIFQSRGKDSKR